MQFKNHTSRRGNELVLAHTGRSSPSSLLRASRDLARNGVCRRAWAARWGPASRRRSRTAATRAMAGLLAHARRAVCWHASRHGTVCRGARAPGPRARGGAGRGQRRRRGAARMRFISAPLTSSCVALSRSMHVPGACVATCPRLLGTAASSSGSISQVLRFPNYPESGPAAAGRKEQVGRGQRFQNTMGRIAMHLPEAAEHLPACVGATTRPSICGQSMACITAWRLVVLDPAAT